MTIDHIDFAVVNRAALSSLPSLLCKWLPDGRLINGEWMAKNPTRLDRRAGSFLINVQTGKWADFATGDKGGDVVSLAAYLGNLSQVDAARRLSDHLGVHHD